MVYTRKNILTTAGLLGLAVFALLVRILGINFISDDMTLFLIPWYDRLAHCPGALAEGFSNYAPSYLYILKLLTYLEPVLPKVIGIKLVSILFDALSAVAVYKLVELKYPKTRTPLLAGLLFLLLPGVFLNSAVWGQADSIYTFFLLGCLYFLLKGKSRNAMIFFSIALSFKLQAVFLLPFLVVLSVKKILPWRWYVFLPVTYIIFALPSVLAGRAWWDVLTIYLHQAGTYVSWSLHAPNPYLFVPRDADQSKLYLVVLAALLLVASWAWQMVRRPLSGKPAMVFCALASVSLVPYILPRMHERYFYPMDVLTFIVAFFMPELWFLPVFSQVSSWFTYSIYLFGGDVFYPLTIAFALTTTSVIVILKRQLSAPHLRS